MNGPIRKVTIFVSLLLAALLVNMTWISVVRTDSLNNDTRNRRVRDAEFSRNRGAILVGQCAQGGASDRSGFHSSGAGGADCCARAGTSAGTRPREDCSSKANGLRLPRAGSSAWAERGVLLRRALPSA